MGRKNCMFQYATAYKGMFRDTDIAEDTDLITLQEAQTLWHKYLPRFIRELQDEDAEPEMVIWINCKDNSSYGDTLAWVNNATETDGQRLYEIKKEYIDVPKPKPKSKSKGKS